MSYQPTYLAFWVPPPGSDAPDPPSSAPDQIEDAARVWGHGLLVGEVLGIEVGAAQVALDTVYRLPDDLPWLFLEDSISVLRTTMCAVRDALATAIDDGRAVGTGGAHLLKSPHFVAGPDGRLQVRTTRFPLDLLLIRLDGLCLMLDFALENDLLVVERFVDDDTH